jgi:predicted transcriptional regulator
MMLSGREMDVMNILWERGSATVAEVLEDLQDDLAYTTVLTILRRLEDKGHVGHSAEGKAHRYRALVERGEVQDSAIRRMTRKLFLDSPRLLMARILNEGKLSEDQLRELRNLLDERLEGRDEEGKDEGEVSGQGGSER